SGTIIVQLISTFIAPVLSRLYTPADYGLLAVFVSCISVLSVICCFRYELAILIPKKNSDADSLLKLSLAITLLFSIVVTFITVVFNKQLTVILANENLSYWLYFLGPVLLCVGITQAFTYRYNRNKNYRIISTVRVFQTSAYSGLSLLMGFLKLNAFGLIISSIISQILSTVFLLAKSGLKLTKKSFELTRLRSIAVKYKEFPYFNLPAALLDTFSINSIILLLNYFFSESVTGSYSFALRMLSIPSLLIGTAIGQVFYQKISEAYNNNVGITDIIYNTWKVLFLIGLAPVLIIFFFGEYLFPFIFGSNWAEAGLISKYLCVLTFFTLISSPTSSAMIVLKRQRIILFVNIIAFIYRPLALLWGYSTNNFLNGIILYIILEIIQILVYNYIMIMSARQSDLNKN
ncbi:MAG: oligosaccharide flippase family protein, partial [Bacteroidota bacterium]|nr:oligosaccharide flippase family protein [Bacteroidota bacterium]